MPKTSSWEVFEGLGYILSGAFQYFFKSSQLLQEEYLCTRERENKHATRIVVVVSSILFDYFYPQTLGEIHDSADLQHLGRVEHPPSKRFRTDGQFKTKDV